MNLFKCIKSAIESVPSFDGVFDTHTIKNIYHDRVPSLHLDGILNPYDESRCCNKIKGTNEPAIFFNMDDDPIECGVRPITISICVVYPYCDGNKAFQARNDISEYFNSCLTDLCGRKIEYIRSTKHTNRIEHGEYALYRVDVFMGVQGTEDDNL